MDGPWREYGSGVRSARRSGLFQQQAVVKLFVLQVIGLGRQSFSFPQQAKIPELSISLLGEMWTLLWSTHYQSVSELRQRLGVNTIKSSIQAPYLLI